MEQPYRLESVRRILSCDASNENDLQQHCDELLHQLTEIQHLTTRDRKHMKLNCVDVIEYCVKNEQQLTTSAHARLQICSSEILITCFRGIEHPYSSQDYALLVQTLTKMACVCMTDEQHRSKCRAAFEQACEYWNMAITSKGATFLEEYGPIGYKMFKHYADSVVHDSNADESLASQLGDECLKLVMQQKSVNSEALQLALSWYNLGVTFYSQSNNTSAVLWVTKSLKAFEVVPTTVSVKAEKLARAQRLLSMVYMHMKHYDKALVTVEKSLDTQLHIDGLYLKIQLLYHINRVEDARSVIRELLANNGCSLHKAVSAVILGASQMSVEAIISSLDDVYARYNDDSVLVHKVRLLLDKCHNDDSDTDIRAIALKIVGDAIASHLRGQPTVATSTLLSIYELAWNTSVTIKDTHLKEAIEWQETALKLLEAAHDVQNIPKCLRCIAYLCMHDSMIDRALECAQQAMDLDPSIDSMMHLTMVHIRNKDAQSALPILQLAQQQSNFQPAYFALVASEAMENEFPEIAANALQALLLEKHRKSVDGVVQEPVKLYMTIAHQWYSILTNESVDGDRRATAMTQLVACLDQAATEFCGAQTGGPASNTNERDESMEYFGGVAYNAGVLCGQQNSSSPHIGHALTLATKFMQTLPLTPERSEKRCELLLLSAAVHIERAWTLDRNQAKDLSAQALACIREYERLVATLQKVPSQAQVQRVHIMTFTAKLFLGDPNLRMHVESVINNGIVEDDTLEQMAHLSMMEPFQSNPNSHQVCKTAIYASIQRKLAMLTIDWHKIAVLFRQLLMVGNEADLLRDAQSILNYAVTHSDQIHSHFPVLDARYIVARCWNIGVRFFRREQYKEAEKYASCAIQLQNGLLAEPERARANELRQMYERILSSADTPIN